MNWRNPQLPEPEIESVFWKDVDYNTMVINRRMVRVGNEMGTNGGWGRMGKLEKKDSGETVGGRAEL